MPFPAPTPQSLTTRLPIPRMALVLALVATLAACGSVDRTGRAFWQPYRPNMQQGNWVTQQQVETLRPGMTREQVRYALGSPTLTPVFHAERWDYPYFFAPGYGPIQERHLTLYFENELLARWEGTEQPQLQPFQQANPGQVPRPSLNTPVVPEAGGAIGTGSVGTDPAAVATPVDPVMPVAPLDPAARPGDPSTQTQPLR